MLDSLWDALISHYASFGEEASPAVKVEQTRNVDWPLKPKTEALSVSEKVGSNWQCASGVYGIYIR
jgi:hypothetical protein